jgi:hypothetical protein
MKLLPEILQDVDDGLEVLVKFSNGNVFGLVNCEMVDECIYQRNDVCIADIRSKIKVSNDVYRIGSKLEFSVDDIIGVKSALSGECLYQKY